MPYSAKTIEERKSLNGMWHKSKAKLIVLRLACGLTSKGTGEVCRTHLFVPDTRDNALLDCARSLVEDGMMAECSVDQERAYQGHHGAANAQNDPNCSDIRFEVTVKGIQYAQAKAFNNIKTKCPPLEAFSKENVKNDLAHAQELLTDARFAILEQMTSFTKLGDRVAAHKFHEVEEELSESDHRPLTSQLRNALARAAKEAKHPEPLAPIVEPKTGRPTKLTPEIIETIAQAIAKGHTDREAALIADIDPDTLVEWKKDSSFSVQIEKAVSIRIGSRIDKIEKGEIGWQGTAWVMERLYRERFSRPEVQFAQQINVAGNSVDLTLAPGQLNALSEAYNAEKQASEVKEIEPS